jgi:Fic family protein
MPEDSTRTESPGIAKADHLYRGFPDFSVWGELSAEDADLWSRFAASLEERKRTASPESLKNAVEVAVRAAALDTGAIEGLYNVDRGFTMTVAVQGLAWQQMVEERGAGVRELFEAQLAAYELVLDAVTRNRPITEVWIRNLHETLLAPEKTYRVQTDQGWQDQELPKGQYKIHSNHVLLKDGTFHAYAPVDRVPDEMHRLMEQIRTPAFEAAHPVLQASYCHYAFVVIHPFADGNGRVARALAATFFYRAQSIPLVIFANQKPAYLDALALGDQGDHGQVISFFKDRGIDTMQLLTESLMTAEAPKPKELTRRIGNPAPSWNGFYDSEIDLIGSRILGEIRKRFREQIEGLEMPGLSVVMDAVQGGNNHPPSGYRSASPIGTIIIENGRSRANRAGILISTFFSLEPKSFPFFIENGSHNDDLEARLEDVHPELTHQFLLRADQWIQRQLGRMLAQIAEKENI